MPNNVNVEAAAMTKVTTRIDKASISGAPGLLVVSGIFTKDGSTYQPFLAVQDSSQGELTQSMQTMGYDEYSGRNNPYHEDVIFRQEEFTRMDLL